MASHVVASPVGLADLMVQAALAPSKTQARNLIKGGGVSLAGEKVADQGLTVQVRPARAEGLSRRRSFAGGDKLHLHPVAVAPAGAG